ncbi:MAG TPA: farnesyl diphosphate synthase [Opitutaceae bacterium]|nr:farnesyl diphosphate synthase [Opitutaceae bacterium]
MDFSAELQRHVARFERGLDLHVPRADTRPDRLHGAMRYSLEAGGKRLRPVLVLAAAELFAESTAARGTAPADPIPAAVAIECVHTYSLIHDDLPCMDNDDLRRGRPTAHKAFDEATALLAGDALLTHAFALLAGGYASQPILATRLVAELGQAAGSRKLIGGQMEDLQAEGKADATERDLVAIHMGKTVAMIEAAMVMGGLTGGVRDEEDHVGVLRTVARHLGLAFQIVDDVLDATADTATLGKTSGKDARAGKTTYVKLHGIDRSRQLAWEQTEAGIAQLQRLPGNSAFLRALAEHMLVRKN